MPSEVIGVAFMALLTVSLAATFTFTFTILGNNDGAERVTESSGVRIVSRDFNACETHLEEHLHRWNVTVGAWDYYAAPVKSYPELCPDASQPSALRAPSPGPAQGGASVCANAKPAEGLPLQSGTKVGTSC